MRLSLRLVSLQRAVVSVTSRVQIETVETKPVRFCHTIVCFSYESASIITFPVKQKDMLETCTKEAMTIIELSPENLSQDISSNYI